MAGFTTRTDNVGDTGKVDMGFHYAGIGRYQLTVTVIGGHGTVQPMAGQYHEFQEVTLMAHPEPGYRVKQWIGTDRDPSWNRNTNIVTMDTGTDKFVTVEFEPDVTRNLLVPDEYPTIEDAVAAASPGGTNIILRAGTHQVVSGPASTSTARRSRSSRPTRTIRPSWPIRSSTATPTHICRGVPSTSTAGKMRTRS